MWSKTSLDNIVAVKKQKCSDFIRVLRDGRVDFVFVRYEKRCASQVGSSMNPAAFEFLTKDRKKPFYDTGLCSDYPVRVQLKEIVKRIEREIGKKGTPLFEGSISFDDTYFGNDFYQTFAVSDYYEDTTGERTKKCFEGWLSNVQKLPPKSEIKYSLDWLNYADDPKRDLGDAFPSSGSYRFEAENRGIHTCFFGQTTPTALFVLGKKLVVPLSSEDEITLTGRIVEMLNPLKEAGYRLCGK